MNKLTNSDYIRAAELLGCSVAAIKAVAEVESRGSGFDDSGRVKILFERHKFYKYTNGKYRDSHPHLCNPNAGGYGGERIQYAKFSQAFALDKLAALLSCSWGKFQIMGFNYRVCGFNSVTEFVEAMKRGEGEQLLAFCRFVKSQNLSRHLKTLDWARFAGGYNGVDYRKNRYDEKMASAYAKFKKEKAAAGDSIALSSHKEDERNQAVAANSGNRGDSRLHSPQPASTVLTPTTAPPAADDSFLAAAFDKNVSPDEIRTAARRGAPRIIARFARPFMLLYAALEAGNLYAWLGVACGVIAVGLLVFWHRNDLKKVLEAVKTKFTA